jgi:hypothetical protein
MAVNLHLADIAAIAVNLSLDRLSGIPGRRLRLRALPELMPRELSGH